MRTFASMLLVAITAAVTSAQSSSVSSTAGSLSSTTGSGSSSMSAELAAIVECNTTQLNEAEGILASNQRAEQCEEAQDPKSGNMLQVTTAEATEMCDRTSCKAALQELYDNLPNCRYNLWGLQYSAKKLLNYCGIIPTNSTDLGSSNGSSNWSVSSNSASFAGVGATDAPSTASSTTADSSSMGSSAATTTTAISAALVATAGFVAAYMA